jgi:hypothetical protein
VLQGVSILGVGALIPSLRQCEVDSAVPAIRGWGGGSCGSLAPWGMGFLLFFGAGFALFVHVGRVSASV